MDSLTKFRWSVRVSPSFVNRLVDSARGILNQFLTDIYIYTDHMKGGQSGKSVLYGCFVYSAFIWCGLFYTLFWFSNLRD